MFPFSLWMVLISQCLQVPGMLSSCTDLLNDAVHVLCSTSADCFDCSLYILSGPTALLSFRCIRVLDLAHCLVSFHMPRLSLKLSAFARLSLWILFVDRTIYFFWA